MDTLSGNISKLIFKVNIVDDLKDFVLSGRMLKVLMVMDGKKSVAVIARILKMDLATIRPAISTLAELQLIRFSDDAMPMLDGAFFDFLKEQLSMVTGPIAQVLFEDAIDDLGGSAGIPKNRTAELIELLARQISDEEQKSTFIKLVMQKTRGA